jgi:DNA-binding transcriptional LysR family regulator
MRNVTLKQLHVFAAVVRTGSVTRAARELHVSAPAVTSQMQILHDQVGLPLIERTAAGMTPTEAGRHLLETAGRIEALLADCAAVLGGLAGGERGSVSVGVVSTAKYFAPRALAALHHAHPAIELRLTVGNRAQVIAGLADYSLDVAVMGRPPQELDVVATEIGEHPHVIVAPPDHPLAGCRAIPAAVLAGESFLPREPGSGTRTLVERFFAEAAIAPRMGMQIDSNETIKQAVIAGLGIAFISGHTIEAEVLDRRLVVLDVAGMPIIRNWYVVHMRERSLLPSAHVARRFLTDEGRAYLPTIRAGAWGFSAAAAIAACC